MSAPTVDAVAELRASVAGPVLTPADDGYVVARTPFNALVERRPAVIVQCLSTGDVVAGLDFARSAELAVSVRGGGHNVAGHAVCDGGVMISLEHLNGLAVDPARRIAHAAGGALWRDFDDATEVHGLAAPGGTFGTTGVAGLTLGGGIGYLLGRFGLSCDQLVGAQVVTADGRVLETSEEDHADLLWALRGGGGNFGVATRLDFQLHPITEVVGGVIVFTVAGACEVMRVFRAAMAVSPDHFTMQMMLGRDPDTSMPIAAVIVCNSGSDPDPPPLQELRRSTHLVANEVARMPYRRLQAMFDMPFGLRHYWKGHFVRELSDDLIDVVVESFDARTGPRGGILIEALHGAATAVAEDATAVSFRSAKFNVSALAIWETAERDQEEIRWARETAAAVEPWSLRGGGYLNYMQNDEPLERVRAAFGGEKFDRLRALKRTYDPKNVFHHNQNIPPA